mgnify:FL=1
MTAFVADDFFSIEILAAGILMGTNLRFSHRNGQADAHIILLVS